MKHLLLTTIAVSTLALYPAIASDDHDHDHSHGEERPQHYEAAEPASWEEALAILEEKGAEMKAAYAAKDYQTMHELSYALEAAAEYLDEQAGELVEAVEEVHHATEDGEHKELTKVFPEFEDRLNHVAGK